MTMECLWVEYDQVGGTKICMFEEDYKQICKLNNTLAGYNHLKLFGESVCRFCLEGLKIELIIDDIDLVE